MKLIEIKSTRTLARDIRAHLIQKNSQETRKIEKLQSLRESKTTMFACACACDNVSVLESV